MKGAIWKRRVNRGLFGLCIPAQTGFAKGGSDLRCLHASVGEKKNI